MTKNEKLINQAELDRLTQFNACCTVILTNLASIIETYPECEAQIAEVGPTIEKVRETIFSQYMTVSDFTPGQP